MNFSGKNVVITGASGGMGILLCEKLAEGGANLALCSNDAEKLGELVDNLQAKYSVKIVSKALDITNEAEVEAFISDAAEKLGKFSNLVNLAGLSIPNNYAETDLSVFETVMDVNVKGSFLTSKHFMPYAAESALIINIGSMAARNTNANAPIYCMAKAAVNKLSEGLLLQYAKKNIRVTTVNPGGADTPFWGTRSVDRSKLMSAEDVVEVI
ncbi:MAG: SDR family oxidoreductase, partial [Clostridia bacterium]|nr:SDR family oxidoreductase [Clostridia bacterium]